MIVRATERLLREAMEDTPVVMVQGPRQSGKSTLVQQISGSRSVITLDDPIVLAEAKQNPLGFLKGQTLPILLDEVQRAPELLLSIKLMIDKDRKPGSFVLTGSANVLALPKVAESLAGRMEVLELLPFSQAELEGSQENFVDRLYSGQAPAAEFASAGASLHERLVRGGFPEPSQRASQDRRDSWYRSYVRTLLDRDVRDLANISGLTQLPRLLALVANRSGQPLNISSLSVDTGVPHTTLTRYLDLLKALYLIHLVPAWSFSNEARLARSPKAFMIDSGLQCYLSGMDSRALNDRLRLEPVLKTMVAGELIKLSRTGSERPTLYHLRTVKQKEVDFVLEARDGRVVGIQVNPDRAVRPGHLDGLKYLQSLAEDRFYGGVVLYDGTETQNLGSGFWAVPISALWS